ncbi:MAG: ERCC4 domain-containing protein [Caldisphaera sp.]
MNPKMDEIKKLRVYADTREEQSGIPRILESYGIIVIRRQLEEGDYIIPDMVIIERKSSYDFIKSLFDGRLFDQAKRLYQKYQNIIYIVEGDFKKVILSWENREKQIESALISLIIDFNVKILWSIDTQSTANYIVAILKKSLSNKESAGDFIIHKKPKIDENREWQLYIIQSFPGVGDKTAEKILDHFGTLEKFFNSSIAELSKIIGEKKASKIKELMKLPYNRDIKSSNTLESFYKKDEPNESKRNKH